MSPIQRQTTFGLVVGTDLSTADGTYVWKGVPYAKPPVGERRWKAPADPGNVTLMGESAGAVNVYALMTSPLLADANPAMVHKLLPISGGISPAGELPAGSVATLAPVEAFRG